MRNNRVSQIPSTITRLHNLKILNLVGNQLSRLPHGMSKMKNLDAIWIAENQVHKFQSLVLKIIRLLVIVIVRLVFSNL